MRAGLPSRMQSELTQQREAYQQKIEAQMARWRADVATMEADLTEATVSDQISLQQQIADLKAKLARAEERLDQMKETTGDAWVELQTEVDDLQQQISKSFNQIQKDYQLASKEN